MVDRTESGGGFTVLDGLALVTGAAVASVHLRSAVPRVAGPIGWFWAWFLFSWLAVVSAGPYLFLVRRFFTRPDGYPRLGDRLWALAGLPWLVAALIRTFETPNRSGLPRSDLAYVTSLTLGLAVVALITVPTLAARFLGNSSPRTRSEVPTPWTHRLGICLAVSWPIQCGVGLIVTG